MTVQEHAVWLSRNGYTVKHKDFYLFTAKFNQAMSGKDEGIVSCKAPQMKAVQAGIKQVDWVKGFQDFIISARIPKYSSGKDGTYQVNGATKVGRELFQQALKEIELVDLRIRMSEYYSQNNGKYRVKVETYFEKEMWRDTGTAGKCTRSNDGATFSEPNL